MRIERVTDPEVLARATGLLDGPILDSAAARFLASPTHHVLLAFDEDDRPIGMVTGVETTHPDKGTEMFLYELGVEAGARRAGVGTALARALATLAHSRGCYGMWVAADADNEAAIGLYRKAGAEPPEPAAVLVWNFGAAEPG